MTKLYLSAWESIRPAGFSEFTNLIPKANILCSFYYYIIYNEYPIWAKIHDAKSFMLDSGAFTMMNTSISVTKCDIERYCDEYADYIREHRIARYFELDLDAIFGYKYVLQLRERLENRVGWQSIPVWHTSRGIKELERQCRDYTYCAFGGIAVNKGTKKYSKLVELVAPVVQKARDNGSNVHILGYTPQNLTDLHIKPYSVDSSSWIGAVKFGHEYYFDGKTIRRKSARPGRYVQKTYWKRLAISCQEWIKYADHVERLAPIEDPPPPDGF